jgi:light-regulated signal transduction histidine kinase (bacteriophytochrome)
MKKEPENNQDSLKELAEEFEAFSYSVSHDLRAPLRTITGFSKILLKDYKDRLDEEGQGLVRMILGSANSMNQMIEALLLFFRIGQKEMYASELNMEDLADEQIRLLQSSIQGRNIEFVRGDLPQTAGDREMISDVLLRLIENSVKFTRFKDRAVIEIGSRPGNGRAVYFIKDNGIGFHQDCLHRLFRMFQRLHSPEQFEGVGCGLAIVRRIVQRHNGQIWAEAIPEMGACFYFTLGRGDRDTLSTHSDS